MQDILVPEKGWRVAAQKIKVPEEKGLLFRTIGKTAQLMGRKEVPDVFKLLFINQRLFWAWLYFASRLMPYGQLSGRERELIILRVAWLCRCRYEWGQHIEIGLRSGLEDADIVKISTGVQSFQEEKERALIQACDDIHAHHEVRDATMQMLKFFYSDKLLIEITMLIGHYQMLAGVINSSGLALEASAEEEMTKFNQRIKSQQQSN